MTEEELEGLCLEWFHDTGWEVLLGSNVTPDGPSPLRSSFSQVIIEEHLRFVFADLNHHIPKTAHDVCIEQVISKLTKPESLDPVLNNKNFHHMLLAGVPIEYKDGDELVKDQALLVDFEKYENNRFAVINQFTVTGTKQPRRPDVVCFLNGLPIAVIELKSPNDEHVDIWDAFNQLQTYKDEIADLFITNEALL